MKKYKFEILTVVLFLGVIAGVWHVKNKSTVHELPPTNDTIPAIVIDSAKVDSLSVDTIKK